MLKTWVGGAKTNRLAGWDLLSGVPPYNWLYELLWPKHLTKHSSRKGGGCFDSGFEGGTSASWWRRLGDSKARLWLATLTTSSYDTKRTGAQLALSVSLFIHSRTPAHTFWRSFPHILEEFFPWELNHIGTDTSSLLRVFPFYKVPRLVRLTVSANHWGVQSATKL